MTAGNSNSNATTSKPRIIKRRSSLVSAADLESLSICHHRGHHRRNSSQISRCRSSSNNTSPNSSFYSSHNSLHHQNRTVGSDSILDGRNSTLASLLLHQPAHQALERDAMSTENFVMSPQHSNVRSSDTGIPAPPNLSGGNSNDNDESVSLASRGNNNLDSGPIEIPSHLSSVPPRRTSMSEMEQTERRASIKSIMTNPNMTPLEKRRSIQNLMDGRRASFDYAGRNPYLEMKARREMEERRNAQLNGREGIRTEGENGGVASTHVHSSNNSATASSLGGALNNGTLSTDANNTAATGRFHRRSSSDGQSALRHSMIESIGGDEDAMDVEHHPVDSRDASMEHIFHGNNNPANSAAATSVTSEEMAKKHPYSARTTAVPMAGAGLHSQPPSPSSNPKQQARRRNSIEFAKRSIETAPRCNHYERKCHIVSPCCGATFGCRICHDDCPVLPPLLDTGDGMMMGAAGGGERAATGGRKYQRVLRTSSMPTSFQQVGPPEHHNVDR